MVESDVDWRQQIWGEHEKEALLRWYDEVGRGKMKAVRSAAMKSQVWKDAASYLNSDFEMSTTGEKVKSTYHNIQRRFREERTKQSKSGAEPSQFGLYNLCAEFFAKDFDVIPADVVSENDSTSSNHMPQRKRRPGNKDTSREEYYSFKKKVLLEEMEGRRLVREAKAKFYEDYLNIQREFLRSKKD